MSEGGNSCLLCNESSKKRRPLHSATNCNLIPTLVELMKDMNIEPAIVPKRSWVCPSCIRSIEKVNKLIQDLQKVENELKLQLKQAKDSGRLCITDDTVPEHTSLVLTPTSRKRLRSSSVTPTCSLSEKRRALDFGKSTPVRRTMESIVDPVTSPAVAVLIKRPDRKSSRVHVIEKSCGLKTIAKSVGRKNRNSIVRQVLKDQKMKNRVLQILAKHVQKEMSAMCSRKKPSLLRCGDLLNFSWKKLEMETQSVAPTFHKILRGFVDVKRRVRIFTGRHYRPTDIAVFGICTAILLRHKNMHMNLLQKYVSLILNNGHASKTAYTRLQKLMMCLSHKSTLTLMDSLGEKYDDDVHTWRQQLEANMTTPSTTCNSASTVDGNVMDKRMELREDVSSSNSLTSDVTVQHHKTPLEATCTGTFTSDTSSSSSSSDSDGGSNHDSSVTPDSPIPSDITFSDSLSSLDEFLGPQCVSSCIRLPTFKVVGDNIDKSIHPRDMRAEHQKRSLHYFHSYAVRDRIDISDVSNTTPTPNVSALQVQALLPSNVDQEAIVNNFSILVGRVLIKYIPYFKKLKCLERHIRHKFSDEMSKKSEVVPLGIYLKGEQKYEEMIEVLDHLHQYVPSKSSTEEVTLPNNEETLNITRDYFDPVIFGGDQMTASRIRGCQRVRSNSEREKEQLLGFIPVVEDWHAKMCYMEVIWKHLYKCSSNVDGSTLYQLRNIINRRDVVKDPSKNMNACEAFLEIVIEAHILSASMSVFEMNNVDEKPSKSYFPDDVLKLSSLQQRRVLTRATRMVLDRFVDMTCKDKENDDNHDHVQAYACQVLTLGMLFLEFKDAIREGDGDRIIRCWKYFLIAFKTSGRTHYSVEAFKLLAQNAFLLSPRAAMQLKWNRTINVNGRTGKNVSCDLHMEHLNKEAKQNLAGLGSNVTDEAVKRVGKSIRLTLPILKHFDTTNGIKEVSGRHSRRSTKNDMEILLKQLSKNKVFETHCGRKHYNFPIIATQGPFSIDTIELLQWMNVQLQRTKTYR